MLSKSNESNGDGGCAVSVAGDGAVEVKKPEHTGAGVKGSSSLNAEVSTTTDEDAFSSSKTTTGARRRRCNDNGAEAGTSYDDRSGPTTTENAITQSSPKPSPRPKPWTLCWCGLPTKWWGHVMPVDLTPLWRRHLVWAKRDGDDLLKVVTARFTSTTVFLTLLVSTEIGVFFSPSQVVEDVRIALMDAKKGTLEFWTGIVLCVSIFFSISALMANFTAWSIFIVLSKENSATILRSSIGLYAAQLPSRLVVLSIYMFFMWICMFWWIILPILVAAILTLAGIINISHIASTYSAVGQIILSSGAMGHEVIMSKEDEEKLSPTELFDVLLEQEELAQKADVPIFRQYRIDYQAYIRRHGDGSDRKGHNGEDVAANEMEEGRSS